MSSSAPAMSPSDMPVSEVLDRARGPRRAEVDELLALAPGPAKHTVYLVSDFAEKRPDLLEELGSHRASTACLYFTRLSGIDRDVLRELLERTLADTRASSA